ncbi:PDZ domain-containing protein, partial [Candidatus Dependentiae bacterium]|nr:PDZ domain-containing protein [Candidatus Dependentiae bacterium]
RGASKILSSGIISSTNYSDLVNIEFPNYIKSDMSINPGVSTAPVFNSKNEVIGICRGNVQNFGIIEPINNIKPIIEKLKRGEKIIHSWMGIYITKADSFSEKEFNIDIDSEKIYVAAVFPGTPAAEAGVQKGDVIISVDNNSHTDVIEYIKYVMSLPSQSEVSLKISRNSKEEELKIKTVDKPYTLRLSPLDELHLYFGLKVICKNGKPYIEKIRKDSYADGTFLKAEKYIKYYLPKDEFPVQKLDAKEIKLDNRLRTKKITNCKMLDDYITNSLFDDILILYIANGNFLDQGFTFITIIQDYFPVI